jgi:hypothetical protein
MTWIERTICVATIAGSAWVSVGCGSSEVPAKQLAQTEASIRAAHEVGADDTPKAALQLKLAKDGMQRAQKQSADGDNERAQATLQEAELDAELAVLLAKQEAIESKANQAKGRADSLDQARSENSSKASE